MYSYLTILCIHCIAAIPGYGYDISPYGKSQQIASTLAPSMSTTAEKAAQTVTSDAQITAAQVTKISPSSAQPSSNQTATSATSATIPTISPVNYGAHSSNSQFNSISAIPTQTPSSQYTTIPSTNPTATISATTTIASDTYELQLSNAQASTTTNIPNSASTDILQTNQQVGGSNSSIINLSTLDQTNINPTENDSGSTGNTTSQQPQASYNIESPIDGAPSASTTINSDSSSASENSSPILKNPAPVVDSYVQDSDAYGDNNNDLTYAPEQIDGDYGSTDSINQAYSDGYNTDSNTDLDTTNYGNDYTYDYTPYE